MNKLNFSAQEYYNFILDKRKKEWEKLLSYSNREKEYPIPCSPKTRKPIKIPKDWTWMTIDQIALKMNAGSTPRGGKKVYQNSGILFIRSQNVQMGRIETKDIAYISEEIHHKMGSSKVNYGNILLNITGASIGRIAWYNLKNYEANVNQHVSVIRLVEEIPDWIVLFFSTRWGQKQILDYQSGSTRQGLNINNQKQLMLPLAPLREQIIIVLILNNLDKIIVNTEKTIELLRILKKGLMQRLFMEGIGHTEFKETKFGRIPKDWEINKLKNLVSYEKGRKPEHKHEVRKDHYKHYLSTEYLRENKEKFYVDPTDKEILADNNSIILVWDGANAGEFFRGCDGVVSSTMVRIDPDNKKINLDYIYYVCLTEEREIRRQTRGTGIPHVDKMVFENIITQIPPMEEQKRIANILLNIDNKINIENNYKTKLKFIKKGLMQDLLTGKKRVKVN